MGELQVMMSQFRKSINFHKDRGYISHYNSGFFEHVHRCQPFHSQATWLHQHDRIHAVFRHRCVGRPAGRKRPHEGRCARLWRHGNESRRSASRRRPADIIVVSRNPEASAQRSPDLASKCTMISYETWNQGQEQPDLVISTIQTPRQPTAATTAAGSRSHHHHGFLVAASLDASGVGASQTLLGMDHWIKVSRNLGKEWDYGATIAKSESMINTIQDRYSEALGEQSAREVPFPRLSNHGRACKNVGDVPARLPGRRSSTRCFLKGNRHVDLPSSLSVPPLDPVKLRGVHGANTEFSHACPRRP